MANKLEISLEDQVKGTRILHIKVNDIELSGRTVTTKDPAERDGDTRLVSLLNEKAQEAVAKDPRFAWETLSDWRGWANQFVNEYMEESIQEKAAKIRQSVIEANK